MIYLLDAYAFVWAILDTAMLSKKHEPPLKENHKAPFDKDVAMAGNNI
jgi:hypothetical protein